MCVLAHLLQPCDDSLSTEGLYLLYKPLCEPYLGQHRGTALSNLHVNKMSFILDASKAAMF